MKREAASFANRLQTAAGPVAGRADAAWRARSRREQMLIAVMAACVAAAAIYSLAVAPAMQARASLKGEIDRIDAALAQTRTAPPVVRADNPDSRPVAVRITALAGEADLEIRRLEEGGGTSTVVLEDAPFGAVAAWVAMIERADGLSTREISVERRPTPGLVSTRIVVEGR